jgi:hypothetical protein
MPFLVRSTVRTTLALAVLSLTAQAVSAQDQCQCQDPGAESSRIANAIGGGLFAGLIAAVIPFHHAASMVAAAPGAPTAGGVDPLVQLSDSTDIASTGGAAPAAGASPQVVGAPLGGEVADPATPASGAAAPVQLASAPLPSVTPSEAAADGLVAPRTATLLPALAMIGVGSLLLGIFFLRVRHPERH